MKIDWALTYSCLSGYCYFQDAESRAEYGEMNVQRIHLQIDQLEDELIAQKQKSKAINDELQEAFNDMVQI